VGPPILTGLDQPQLADTGAPIRLDAHGRIMVLMTHNTDISDAWEREGESGWSGRRGANGLARKARAK